MALDTLYGVCGLRLTRRLADGTFDLTAKGGYMRCGGVISLTQTDVFLTGDDKEQKDSCGNLCATRKYDDRFKREDLKIELCGDEREIDEVVGGLSLILSGVDIIGTVRYGDAVCETPVAKTQTFVEAWVEQYLCDGPADAPWRRLIFPAAKLTPDFSKTLNGDASTVTLNGFTEGVKPRLVSTGPFGDLPDSVVFDPNALPIHWYEVDDTVGPPCDTGSGYVQATIALPV